MIALGLLTAACGSTDQQRMTTGGLAGAAAGGIIGGPVGALVGLGVGGLGGAALDESADRKISQLGDAFVNRPLAQATGTGSAGGTERSGAAERRTSANYMSSSEVHDELHDAGYERVYNVRRDGDTYMARGVRNGRAYDIEADATTGQVIAENEVGRVRGGEARSGEAGRAGRTEQQIRQKLRQEGYSSIRNLQRQGDAYTAQARWENATYDIRVDARTGRIISSNEATGSGAGTTGGASGAGSGAPTGGAGTGGTSPGSPPGAAPTTPPTGTGTGTTPGSGG